MKINSYELYMSHMKRDLYKCNNSFRCEQIVGILLRINFFSCNTVLYVNSLRKDKMIK